MTENTADNNSPQAPSLTPAQRFKYKVALTFSGLTLAATFALVAGSAAAPAIIDHEIDEGHDRTAKAVAAIFYPLNKGAVLSDGDGESAPGLKEALLKNCFDLAEFFIRQGANTADVLDLYNNEMEYRLGFGDPKGVKGHYQPGGETIDWEKVDFKRGWSLLLKHGGPKAHDSAMFAAMDGDADRLRFLADKVPFDGDVLRNAATANTPDALDYLLTNFSFTTEDKNSALSTAAKDNRPTNFHHILDHFNADQSVIDSAFITAAGNEAVHMIDDGLRTLHLTNKVKRDALDSAADYGLAHGSFSAAFNHLMHSPHIARSIKVAALQSAYAAESDFTHALVDNFAALKIEPPALKP